MVFFRSKLSIREYREKRIHYGISIPTYKLFCGQKYREIDYSTSAEKFKFCSIFTELERFVHTRNEISYCVRYKILIYTTCEWIRFSHSCSSRTTGIRLSSHVMLVPEVALSRAIYRGLTAEGRVQELDRGNWTNAMQNYK